MAIVLIWTAVLVLLVTLYLRRTYSRFSDYGVKNMDVIPLFGNMFRVICRLDHITRDLERLYDAFPDERFVGRYEFVKPVLLIRDLELVKKITVKDFEHFIDHRSIADASVEPLFARNLIALNGQEWKDMRSTLSPAFTSSKIKLMVPFMHEVGEQMIRALKMKIFQSSTGYIKVDTKDLTSRYANDVIASCAFGLKVDSHTHEHNQFYEMGRMATTFNFTQMLIAFTFSTFPSLSKKLNLTIFSKQTRNFFLDIILNTMKDREAHNILRPDMIHLLMEAKKGKLTYEKVGNENHKDTGFATVEESSLGKNATNIKRVWTDVDLVAQAVLFFIAGFETVSSAMIFALHELAVHPEIQERLALEIKEHNLKYSGRLDFSSIQSMTYMDMVVSEVLRLWPPAVNLDRVCVKDYNLGKPNGRSSKDYIIRKGESLAIPVWCFHRDPDYFPNPLKFDPERFSEENKHNINPTAYMPFGLGPRNCIGSRFALCELKVLLYQILLHMEILPSKTTKIPAKMSTKSFQNRIDGGHWLRFKVRDCFFC